MWAFAGFTLLVASLFGLFALAFSYAVEDSFFEAGLREEAQRQLEHFGRHGRWRAVSDASMRLYSDRDGMPDDLRVILKLEPGRKEIAGRDGRYYHVLAIGAADAPTAWLVDEVGGELVVRQLRGEIFMLLAGTFAVLVIVGLGLGHAIARRTSGPLSRLAAMVEARTPDQPAPPFASLSGDDEVGILARGLHALDARISAFVEGERAFARDASHELRTPLAVIRSAAERVQAEPGLSAEAGRQLAHIEQSALQLEQTVTLLLSLARDQQQAPEGDPQDCQLLPIIERVVVEQSPLLQAKPVEVHVDVDAAARMRIPPAVAQVILGNLIGNAFAHTQRGQVRISTSADGLQIINEGELAAGPEGFDGSAPFQRGEGSSGFGLGLSIVRRVAARYDIDMCVERQPGRACVRLTSLVARPRDPA
jgi:signal transduction histidine kinase